MKHYTRYDAMKGEDGYWYVVHVELRFLETYRGVWEQSTICAIVSGKMTRKEAEGTANKRNGF